MREITGRVFTIKDGFVPGKVVIDKGIITDIKLIDENMLTDDQKSRLIIPGLIDMHMHGCMSFDTCDASYESLAHMAEYERDHGITSFCPASMTLPKQKLVDICHCIKEAVKSIPGIVGLYLEGPFISCEKAGAQDRRFIKNPDCELFEMLFKESGDNIRVVAIAPETGNAIDFIASNKDRVVCSIAHTNSSYQQAIDAINAGARHATHLYNAMTRTDHREPGCVEAVMDSKDVFAELICDTQHVHPAVVRNTFKALRDDRIILISDSMEATGMPDGEYELGGQKVFKKGRKALLNDGMLAGSVSNLFDCMKNAVSIGINLESAIKTVTCNPAIALNIYEKRGSLDIGKKADIVIMDDKLNILEVIT